MFMNIGKLTQIEHAILRVLLDGDHHTFEELGLVIDPDGLCSRKNVTAHVRKLRKKLPADHGIICEYVKRSTKYRLVRFISYSE